MTFSIWLEPTDNDFFYLKTIIKNLAEKYNSPIFDPHVTIDSEIKKIPTNELIIKSMQNLSKIDIISKDLQYSNYIWKTLFIQLENNSKLQQIQDTLRNELCYSSTYNLDPHISLMYKKLDENKKNKIILNTIIKSRYSFDKISIIKSSNKVENWNKIFTIKLKN